MPDDNTSSESTDPPSSRSEPLSSPPAPRTGPRGRGCCASSGSITSARWPTSRPSRSAPPAGSRRSSPCSSPWSPSFLALPIYCYIAGRSPHGGGSTALLERVIPGWFGKLLLLVLLAFGAVDLVFTRTFSAAAAAEHITRSPCPAWQQTLDAATRGGEGLRAATPALAPGTDATGCGTGRPSSR